MKILQPPGWPRPKGYSNGISAKGRMIFTAGVVGWDENESFPDYTLHGQFAQALMNTLEILEAQDADQAKLVELRYFAGLTIEQTAEAMSLSPATVKREWALARAWLKREMLGEP